MDLYLQYERPRLIISPHVFEDVVEVQNFRISLRFEWTNGCDGENRNRFIVLFIDACYHGNKLDIVMFSFFEGSGNFTGTS